VNVTCRHPGCNRPRRAKRDKPTARLSLWCHTHETRRTRTGSASRVKCASCRQPFDREDVRHGGTLCPSCVNSVRCAGCGTSVSDKRQRSRARPWCGSCNRPLDPRKTRMREIVERHLSALPRRERVVLSRRYGIGCRARSLEQVATALGLTRLDVRRAEARGLCAVRKLEADRAPPHSR
jgi:hypothetical protein